MKHTQYIRVYASYLVAYMSYKIVLYTLDQICEQVDTRLDNENEVLLPDDLKNISTTHSYNIGQEVVHSLKTRGGQAVALTSVKKLLILNKAKNLVDKVFIRPISKIVVFLIMRIPITKKIYRGLKALKIIIASLGAMLSVRLIARFDYWALILTDALPQLPIETRIILSGIRRLRMGKNGVHICIQQSTDIGNLVKDEGILIEKKEKELLDFFTFYEMLPENHLFKNNIFTCIVYMLIFLAYADKNGFKLAIRLLYRLLRKGIISLETYREIVSQLVIGGVPIIDVIIE